MKLDGKTADLSGWFESYGLPRFESEVRFHPTRMWRFDWAYTPSKVAVEIQGGTFIGGAHSRGARQRADFEKLNQAQIMGWIVIQVLPEQIRSGEAFLPIKDAIESRR